jgi:hypothetical protein
MATWRAGGPLVHHATDRRGVERFPDAPIAATTGAPPALPARPFARTADGRTAVEAWLEERHQAVGGAAEGDVGRWLRFPWGGRVTVDAAGGVTFVPEDMAAGSDGELVVAHAGTDAVSHVRLTVA